MVEILKHRGPISIRTYWFADSLQAMGIFRFNNYQQCRIKTGCFGYVRKPFYTILIDLKSNVNDILAAFDQSTRYEIRRAEKDGTTFGIVENICDFTNYYNTFASTKGLPILATDDLLLYRNNFMATKAVLNENTLVMHAYVRDDVTRRVRLLHSASLFRNAQNTSMKAEIGRANRYLHYKDIMLFKEQGFELYDLGGYTKDADDQSLLNINKFKEGFGGYVVEESHFYSLPLFILLEARRVWTEKFSQKK